MPLKASQRAGRPARDRRRRARGGAVHLDPGGRGHVYANFGGIVEPYFVLDNLGVESGGAKLLRYVFGGGFVFGRASDVGRLG